MAYKLIDQKYRPCVNATSCQFICDTDADVADLPKCCSGSTAVSVATANVYVVNASGEWVLFGGIRTIIFKNGITGNTIMPEPVSGIVGEGITFPVPKMSNYNFSGWYLDYACTEPFEETTFRSDSTLYANWVSNTSEQIKIFSYNGDNSRWTNEDGPTRKAIAASGNPEIICLQNMDSVWLSQSFTGYTAPHDSHKNQKYLIFFKTDKFNIIAGGSTDYCSYAVLKRKADGALFAVINAYFDNSVNTDEAIRQAQLAAMWERINGIWKDANRGLMPMIITGSFGSGATPTDSNVYRSLTENSLFSDVSKVAKLFLNDTNATLGDYVFASHHLQHSVESYDLLTNTGSHYAFVVNAAIPNVCSHVLTKTEAIDATCTTSGNKEYYTCSIGGKVYADEYGTVETTIEDCIIPALGHTTDNGMCERCGGIYIKETPGTE